MINRAAFRLATVMALNNGRIGTGPTLAGQQIFDTRIMQHLQFDRDDVAPFAVVYTDDSEESDNSNQTFSPTSTSVRLDIELKLAVKKDGVDAHSYFLPETEPELELKLDLFEDQVRQVLFHQVAPWPIIWRDLIVDVSKAGSFRVHSDDSGTQLAVRVLSLSCDIKPDCPPQPFDIVASDPDISDILAAIPGLSQELQDTLKDRLRAAAQIPDPLSSIIVEIEKSAFVAENTGGEASQEAQSLRKMLLGNAHAGPYAAIQAASTSAVKPWQVQLDQTQYVDTGLHVKASAILDDQQ